MARGRFAHTMDAKGRLSIPAALREELQARDDRPPFLTNLVDCPAVGLYPHDRWLEIEQRLSNMSQTQPEIQKMRRMLVSGAVECPIDGQGRILIPPHLREHAGLEREVTIAGVGGRIEIWDRGRFDDELRGIREHGPEVSRVAAELGL
ncbi:MAG: division/cell wall cluster transcriptional repressor MraZ [Myxococcota bacterium]|nr:division/cell wall cluster transcriptional repressor MraZ [Myxococcota bacterium]